MPGHDLRAVEAGQVPQDTCAAGESSVIQLHLPLPSVGVSTGMERECQQNDGLAGG